MKEKELRKRILRELKIKAKFLSHVSLVSIVIFSVILMRHKAFWGGNKFVFIFSFLMEIFSFGLFTYLRRMIWLLESNPVDEQIAKSANFLSCFYYPKFIFREKENSFIITLND